MRITLFLFGLFISFNAFSQEFVVKENGDTLFGEVKVKESGGYKISVKTEGESDFIEFAGKEIRAYQTGEKSLLEKKEKTVYTFFVRKEIVGDGTPYIMFLQPLHDNSVNKMNLYIELRSISFVKDMTKPNSTYEIQRPGVHGPTITNTNTVYYIQKGGGTVRVNQFEYKTTLSNLLSDCLEISKKIGKKGYKYDDMDTIINEYNSTCGKK